MSKGRAQDLENLRQALTSTLTLLTAPPLSLSQLSLAPTPSPVSALHSDLRSLLTLLKSHVTSLALAIGKPPITPHAALPYLTKIGSDWRKVGYIIDCCLSPALAREAGRDGEGEEELGALGKEWGWVRDEVGEGLVGLLNDFKESIFPSSTSATPTTNLNARQASRQKADQSRGYLIRVGVIYAPIERALLENGSGLSRDGKEAMRKKWVVDGEGLRDGVEEVGDLLAEGGEGSGGQESGDEGEGDGDGDDDESDDGWGGLMDDVDGGGKRVKLSSEDKEMVKKLLPLIKLPILLHTHILKQHLTSPTPLPSQSDPEALLSNPSSSSSPSSLPTPLLPLSSSLLSTQDALLAALNEPSPLSLPTVQSLAHELKRASLDLHTAISDRLPFPSLSSLSKALPAGDGPKREGSEAQEEDETTVKKRKWLSVWKETMDRVSKEVDEGLSRDR